MNEELKNKFYKRWWFWVLIVICFVIIIDVAKPGPTPPQQSLSMVNPTTPVPKTVVQGNSSSNSASTVLLGGITYNIYTLAGLQNANLPKPSDHPSFVEIHGTITKFIFNSAFMITDGQNHNVLIMGNDGSIHSDKTPLMSGLNVGDKITVNGMYIGKAGDDSFAGSFISSLPSSTPTVEPIGGDTGLVVNSAGTPNNGTWTQVFSYTHSSGDVVYRAEHGSTSVPSFTVDGQHWRIRWQIKNNDNMDGSNNAWLTYQKNNADASMFFMFQNQKVVAGYSASDIYDGVGSGVYYVNYDIWANTTFNFVVEELK